MRYTSTLQLLVIFVLTISCAAQPQEAQEESVRSSETTELQGRNQPKLSPADSEGKDYVPGEILVKFRDDTNTQRIRAIQRELHLVTIRIVSEPKLYLMRIADGSSVESVIERLGDYKEVQYSEPNYLRTTH